MLITYVYVITNEIDKEIPERGQAVLVMLKNTSHLKYGYPHHGRTRN